MIHPLLKFEDDTWIHTDNGGKVSFQDLVPLIHPHSYEEVAEGIYAPSVISGSDYYNQRVSDSMGAMFGYQVLVPP